MLPRPLRSTGTVVHGAQSPCGRAALTHPQSPAVFSHVTTPYFTCGYGLSRLPWDYVFRRGERLGAAEVGGGLAEGAEGAVARGSTP